MPTDVGRVCAAALQWLRKRESTDGAERERTANLQTPALGRAADRGGGVDVVAPPAVPGAEFVGLDNCSQCHGDERAVAMMV